MLVEPGDIVALASSLGWAGTSVLARYLSNVIPAFWYNAIRIGVAAAIMVAVLPWSLTTGEVPTLTPVNVALLVGSVLTGFAIGDTCYFESMRRLGVARAAPIAGCHPLLTAVLAVAILREPVTLGLLVGVVVIGVGVWLITTDQAGFVPARDVRGGMLLGVSLALVAATGWAFSSVMVKPAVADLGPVMASTIRLPIGTAVLLLVAARGKMIDSRRLVLTGRTVAWLALSGVLTVVSATFFLWSIDLVGAARTAGLSSVSPIFSAGIAVALLGERLSLRVMIGIAVSAIGVLAIVLAR
jgi:drug/metabolite transporter (DMT)-like permease